MCFIAEAAGVGPTHWRKGTSSTRNSRLRLMRMGRPHGLVVRIPRLGIRPGRHRGENENHVAVRSDEEKADVEKETDVCHHTGPGPDGSG